MTSSFRLQGPRASWRTERSDRSSTIVTQHYDSAKAAPGSGAGAISKVPLGTAAEQIEKAKAQARAAREAAGLGPADDGPFTEEALKARKKRKRR
jgi:hypothetical protein